MWAIYGHMGCIKYLWDEIQKKKASGHFRTAVAQNKFEPIPACYFDGQSFEIASCVIVNHKETIINHMNHKPSQTGINSQFLPV